MWPGWLRQSAHARTPISPSATSSLTWHLWNTSPSPAWFDPSSLMTEHGDMQFGFPTKSALDPELDVWRPSRPDNAMVFDYRDFDFMRYGFYFNPMLVPLKPEDYERRTESHRLLAMAKMRYNMQMYSTRNDNPWWQVNKKRDGITLLQDEAYSMRLHFWPGWLNFKMLRPYDPSNQAGVDLTKARLDHLVVMSRTVALPTKLPRLIPGAVAPGQPVKWEEPPFDTSPVNGQWVPFKADRKAPDLDPEDELVIRPGVSMRLELPPVVAGRDVVATYLLGNSGTQALWVWQRSFVPAQATFTLRRQGMLPDSKPLAEVDGEAFKPVAALAPYRAPLLLCPGEYLAYRRPLLASELPIQAGGAYTLSVALDAQWSDRKPSATTAPTVTRVSATVAWRAQR